MNLEYLVKWKTIFDNIPKPQNSYVPTAQILFPEDALWHEGKVAIVVELGYEAYACNLTLYLNTDETARFDASGYSDYDEVSKFIEFKGNWKDAYLKVIAIMKEDWPELQFPSDQEILSKDLT